MGTPCINLGDSKYQKDVTLNTLNQISVYINRETEGVIQKMRERVKNDSNVTLDESR